VFAAARAPFSRTCAEATAIKSSYGPHTRPRMACRYSPCCRCTGQVWQAGGLAVCCLWVPSLGLHEMYSITCRVDRDCKDAWHDKPPSRRTSAERGLQQQQRVPVLLPPCLSPLRHRLPISMGLRRCARGSQHSSVSVAHAPSGYLLKRVQSGCVLMSPPMLSCAVTVLVKLAVQE